MSFIKFQNLSTPFVLTKAEDIFLRHILKLESHKSWDIDLKAHDPAYNGIRDGIKDKIKTQLSNTQNHFCIYCGLHFDIVGISEREHIANKARYPQFTYHRRNIALSCRFCNGTSKKGSKNTISNLANSYRNCIFNIIHPFFDKFEDHIEPSLNGSILFFSPLNNSPKGQNTIRMFKLMNGKQAELRGAAVVKYMYENNILPPYDPLRKMAIKNSYIM